MFYNKQKRNQFTITVSVLLIALVILSITLMRSISTLLSGANSRKAATVEVVTAFDYTRDRDQYWYPAMPATEPFDYTRDRDQYWQPAEASFDYTRDRDQYWYPAVPAFNYMRDREQYELS